jgi:diguanylate cyclase (GGDEF)-like protein
VEGLMGLAERIRKAVESKPVHTEAGEISVTASLGVAVSSEEHPHDAQWLLRMADDALYQAKHRGRNRCELALEADATRARPEKMLSGAVPVEKV